MAGGIFYVVKPRRGLCVCDLDYEWFDDRRVSVGLCSLQMVHLMVEEDAFANVGEALRKV